MGRVGRDYYRKKFEKLLDAAKDEEFFNLVWAVDALQSNREEAAAAHLRYPAEAATSDMGARLAIYKWELETLINQRLLYPKWKQREGKNRELQFQEFGAAGTVAQCLRDYENAESGIRLAKSNIFDEMNRIGYRQFHWQRGYFNVQQFYRNAFIYGQGNCRDYFENSYGLTFDDFSLIGTAYYTGYREHPSLRADYSLNELGVGNDVVMRALALLSNSYDNARKRTAQIQISGHGVAFQPSFIRQFPIISFGSGPSQRLRAPLPQLLIRRITSGLYYDIVGGGQVLLNEVSKRFELYSKEYIQRSLPRFQPAQSERYRYGGGEYETADIRIMSGESIVVAIECKATKLTFPAQFGDDPSVEGKRVYDEIAKGIFQLWRYFSHARRGIIDGDAVTEQTHGIVLTLDSWLMLSRGLQDELIKTAEELAKKDAEIIQADRHSVIICSIETLEATLATATEETFLRALSAAEEDRYQGYMLSGVHREVRGEEFERKPFPFPLEDVLPWMARLNEYVGKWPMGYQKQIIWNDFQLRFANIAEVL